MVEIRAMSPIRASAHSIFAICTTSKPKRIVASIWAREHFFRIVSLVLDAEHETETNWYGLANRNECLASIRYCSFSFLAYKRKICAVAYSSIVDSYGNDAHTYAPVDHTKLMRMIIVHNEKWSWTESAAQGTWWLEWTFWDFKRLKNHSKNLPERITSRKHLD